MWIAFAAVASLMVLLWIASVPLRDVSIVDIGWGPAFALFAWVQLAADGSAEVPALTVATLVTAWGVRLGAHLAVRNLGKGEDRRYQEFRRRVGPSYWWVSLFTVFLLQGALVCVVSLPVNRALAASLNSFGSMPWLVVGLVVYAVGLFFEAVGDWQLTRFKADPSNRGAVMDRGLWRYTRHPNYFGDCCVWWGIYAVGLAAGAPWWTALGPVVMTVLLLRVSGVALLEKDIGERRPGYAEYARRTAAFFPRPPREP